MVASSSVLYSTCEINTSSRHVMMCCYAHQQYVPFRRHWATKSLNSAEKSPSSTGGGLFGMRKMTYEATINDHTNEPQGQRREKCLGGGDGEEDHAKCRRNWTNE